jgi:protein-S-isoprenylcysteine O-methyltransferase Ste14
LKKPATTLEPQRESALQNAIRWIHRRRPFLTALFVIAVIGLALVDDTRPAELLRPRASAGFVVPWLLMLVGVAVRIWGAGNLRKNQEITRTGIYRMVRHPLYVGSLAMFLAMFVTVGDPLVGVALFVAMVVLVYYPTMLDEEAYLHRKFPEQRAEHAGLPRLVPNLLRLPDALRSDRFTFSAAWGNFGIRSLGFLVALPVLLEAIRWVERR